MSNIRKVIYDVGEIMRFQLSHKGLNLNIIINDNVPQRMYTDLKRFKQVLYNLLGNSANFTFSGFLNVKVAFSGNRLITEVEDSGIGIASDNLLKLSKFFGTLTNSWDINRGGMGLGLTISKILI